VKGPLVELRLEEHAGIAVAIVEGEIESSNADDLKEALSERLSNESAGVVLDLSGVTYLDSAGIELLFDLAHRLRAHRQALGLVVPADAPMVRVLRLCGIDRIARIDATLDAALPGVGAGPAEAAG
jgi:anti-anti-sigma factor